MKPMSKVTIRAAQPLDLPKCLELDASFSTDYVWQMESRTQEGQIALTFRSVRLPRSMQVAYPRNPKAMSASWQMCDAMLVAEDGRGLVGFAAMSKRPVQAVTWLSDLIVSKAARREGVGSALLAAVVRWGREQQLKWLIVEVQTKNYPAISFCQKHGLPLCGLNDRHFTNQDIALFFAQAV